MSDPIYFRKAYPVKKNTMANRYKKGDLVYAKGRPCVILVVQLYVRNVYYCTIQNGPGTNELVYLESELRPYNGSPSIIKQVKLHY